MGYGLRYEYGMFKQTIKDGWQVEQPDNWLRRPDPWEVIRPHEKVGVKLNCSFELRGGALRAVLGRTSRLIGIPYDRPVVGYGGKTINTLRLWAATAPDYFDFKEFSSGDFVGAVAETLTAESLTRVLYPDDSTSMGQGLRFVQEYFLVACSLADLLRRFRDSNSDWNQLPARVAIQLNDTHPTMAVPELMRILLLTRRKLGWDEAWDLTQNGDTRLYQSHRCCRKRWRNGRSPGSKCCCRGICKLFTKSTAGSSMMFALVFPATRAACNVREPDRGRRRAQGSHGQSGHCRLAQHQRRVRNPLRIAALADGQGFGGDFPGAIQQQD